MCGSWCISALRLGQWVRTAARGWASTPSLAASPSLLGPAADKRLPQPGEGPGRPGHWTAGPRSAPAGLCHRCGPPGLGTGVGCTRSTLRAAEAARCAASRPHPNPSPTAGDCWYHIPPPPKQRLKQVSAGHTSVFALDENGKWLLIARGHLGRGFPEHPDEMRPDPCPPRPQHKTFLSPMRAASLRSAFPQAPLPPESCRVGSTSPPPGAQACLRLGQRTRRHGPGASSRWCHPGLGLGGHLPGLGHPCPPTPGHLRAVPPAPFPGLSLSQLNKARSWNPRLSSQAELLCRLKNSLSSGSHAWTQDECASPVQHDDDVAGCRQAWEGRAGPGCGQMERETLPVRLSVRPGRADPAVGQDAQGLTSLACLS